MPSEAMTPSPTLPPGLAEVLRYSRDLELNVTLPPSSPPGLALSPEQLRRCFASDQLHDQALAGLAASSHAAPQAALGGTPPSNTGVQNTQPPSSGPEQPQTTPKQQPPKQALIDYLRFTVLDQNLLPWAKLLFSPSLDDWAEQGGGWNFYSKARRCGPFLIFTEGIKPGMGFCVQVSGQACRELEDTWKVVNDATGEAATDEKTGEIVFRRTWETFLSELLEKQQGGVLSFSRLDVALDDLTGALDLEQVRAAVKAEAYTCRSRFRDIHESSKGKGQNGLSITLGRRDTSTRVLRFYDKVAEQIAKKKPVEVDYWVRCELECIGERAEKMAQLLAGLNTEEGRLQAVCGCIREFADFKDIGTDSNLSRCASAPWWSAFLSGWEKIKLTLAPIVRTFEKSEAWLINQVAGALAMVSAAKEDAGNFVAGLIERGKDRLKPRHLALIQREKRRLADRVPCRPVDAGVRDPFACDPALIDLAELFPDSGEDVLREVLTGIQRAQEAKRRRQEWAAAAA